MKNYDTLINEYGGDFEMSELWESMFIENKAMWGFEPAYSAILAKDFFLKNKVKDILIPGIGYGRNAPIFIENGLNVTGIEISKTAINLARENELNMNIFHGSVTDMPFDNKHYDGIFCYALLHLLNNHEREKFIKDCYDQLEPDGYMTFVTVSKEASMYGKGKQLGKDYFEVTEGMKMFFYDVDSIKQDFEKYGIIEVSEVIESNMLRFIIVTCQKKQ